VALTETEAQVQEPPAPRLVVDEAHLTRSVLRLAWPVVLERVSLSVLAAVDALLVGQFVGSAALAGVGIAGLLFWLPLSGALGIEIGTTTIVSWDFGARRLGNLRRSAAAALVTAAGWGALVAVAFIALAGPLMTVMGADNEAHDAGVEFIRSAAPGAFFFAIMYAAAGSLRGCGYVRAAMFILLAVQLVNALVTTLLITGWFGLPELGVLASGVGFSAAGFTGAVLALAVLFHGFGVLRLQPGDLLHAGGTSYRRLGSVGLPVAMEEVQFQIAFLVYGRIIFSLGETEQAAHAVALRALEVAIVPGFALGAACTTLVGQSLGAGRPELAEVVARKAQQMAMTVMVVLGGALAVFSPQVTRLFVDDPEVVDVSEDLLRVFALAFPAMGTSASLAGALRGAGDVRYVLSVITATAWLVRIPVAAICALALDLGAPGAWFGAAVENNVRGLLIYLRFRSGKWKQRHV
jgi:putative MATE family efflux protein